MVILRGKKSTVLSHLPRTHSSNGPVIGGTFIFFPVHSSILNLPGESTLRRDFLRLQLANKERSEALRRQQLEQQQRENEEHKRQLLAERQKRIEEQKEQRRRLEEVSTKATTDTSGLSTACLVPVLFEKSLFTKTFAHTRNGTKVSVLSLTYLLVRLS